MPIMLDDVIARHVDDPSRLAAAAYVTGFADGLSVAQEEQPLERIRCMECGKTVSTAVPAPTIVRAYVICPECIEQNW
jgi:hypothetical protein